MQTDSIKSSEGLEIWRRWQICICLNFFLRFIIHILIIWSSIKETQFKEKWCFKIRAVQSLINDLLPIKHFFNVFQKADKKCNIDIVYLMYCWVSKGHNSIMLSLSDHYFIWSSHILESRFFHQQYWYMRWIVLLNALAYFTLTCLG